MRLPFRLWKSFFASLGQIRQARRRAKEARNKRRSLRRRHELTAFEPRVVMNADPIAVDDELTTEMGQAVQFSEDDLKANDFDADGDALAVVGLHGRPLHGSIEWDSDGSLIYTPDAGFTGVESIDYVLSDGHDHEVRATINIQVNDPAPANTDFSLVSENHNAMINDYDSYTFHPMGNVAFDPEGDVSFVLDEPEFGSITDNGDGTYTFDPQGTSGVATIVVHYSDGEFAHDWTISIVVETPELLQLYSSEQEVVLEAGESFTFYPAQNISANPQGAVDVAIQQGPGFGTLIDNGDGSYIFDPSSSQGTTTVVVHYFDGATDRYFTLTLCVGDPDYQPPTAQNDEYEIYVPRGTTDATIFLSQYPPQLSNDSDPADGGLTLINPNFSEVDQVLVSVGGSYQYEYTVADATGGTATGFVTIFVYETPNHAPSANTDEYFITAPHGADGLMVDMAEYPPIFDNDFDVDGDSWAVEYDLNEDTRYAWVAVGSSCAYEYWLDDGFGGRSSAQVIIYVTSALNEAPEAFADSYPAPYNGFLSVGAAEGLLANDTDADGDALTIETVENMSTAQGGLVSIAANGSFIYTPAADFAGTDSFSYVVADGFGGSATGTATLVVEGPVNQAPTFTPGASISARTDAGQIVIAGWAKNVAAGPAEESWQSTYFTIDVDQPELFDPYGLPDLVFDETTGDYDLVFTPNAGAAGAATLSVVLHDSAGAASDPVTCVVAVSPFGGDAESGGGVAASPAAPMRVGVARTNIEAKEGENGNKIFVTVLLSQPATQELEVDWIAQSGTAYAGVDFEAARGMLTFAVGEAAKTIEITLTDDDLDRGDDRAFQVVLTGAIGAEVVEGYEAVNVTLAENDATVNIYADTSGGVEGTDGYGNPSQLHFVVELLRELDHDVTIDYAIGGSGAGDVADTGSGSVTFYAGETYKVIALDILDDDAYTTDPEDENLHIGEPTKLVIVTISTTDAGAMIDTGSAAASITDDDWQEYKVTGQQIPVWTEFRPEDYTAGDIIDLPDDLADLNDGYLEFEVPENWGGRWFYVWGDEEAWQSIDPRDVSPVASISWVDSDPLTEEPGAKAKFRITVVGIGYGGTAGPVTVNYTTRSVTAVAGEDFEELTGSVTFLTDGYQDIEIDLAADDLVEPSERFALAITDVSKGSVDATSAFAQVKADARVTKITFVQNGSTGELRFDRGTYRFFPDAKFVGGQLQAGPTNTVRVRAEVDGMKAGDLVYFAAFDVDDPTFFGSQWDNDIGIAGRRGNDNLGKIDPNNPYQPIDVETTTTLGFSGLLRDSDAPNNAAWTAPANGRNFPIQSAKVYYDNIALMYYAEVDLLTSFQPGDNFRIVALPQRQPNNNPANVPTYVEDAFQALDFADESINAQPAAESGMAASRVLTVWRKLHVELDVMQSAEGQAGDQVTAQATAVNGAVVTLNNVVGTVTANSLAGGVLQIGVGQAATYYAVTGNSAVDATAGTMTVTVNLNSAEGANNGAFAALAAGDAVLLHDDDKRVASMGGEYSIVPKIDPASDEVRDAVRAFLQGGVNQQTNRFAGAFVEADFTTLASLASSIPFEAHSTPTDGDDPLFGGQSYRGSAALENDPRFWVSYLAVAYQTGDPGPSTQYGAGIPDADWDTGYVVDALTGGEEPAIAVEWSVLYVENLRDVWQQVANAGLIGGAAYVPRSLLAQIAFMAAHEIGKQLDVAALESNPSATPSGINDESPNLMSSRQLVYTNDLSALTLLPQDAIFLRRNFKAGPRRQ